MAAAVCSRCGRAFVPGGDPHPPEDALPDTLAGLAGAAQPPEAAAALAGATPFDARLGTDSGPVEYVVDSERLCPACRAESAEAGAR